MKRQSTLRVRRVAIDTYKENVAYLHRDCNVYRSEGFQALSKVEICTASGKKKVLATLNVVDDASITAEDELGLSIQSFQQLNVEEGVPVTVAHAKPAPSLDAVHRKIAGVRDGAR